MQNLEAKDKQIVKFHNIHIKENTEKSKHQKSGHKDQIEKY